ncbi:MAG TPA: hypothetical protein VMU01_07870 [Rhizomicrobium sp.]|nr:hypothetical protein [Rhizomicrobium sp.]
MSVSSIGGSIPQYKVPITPQAKLDDERTESVATKQKEEATGKEAAAPVKSSAVAVDIKA